MDLRKGRGSPPPHHYHVADETRNNEKCPQKHVVTPTNTRNCVVWCHVITQAKSRCFSAPPRPEGSLGFVPEYRSRADNKGAGDKQTTQEPP